MEFLGHEGTGCSQGQTSGFPMVYSILCNFCGFSGMRNTTGKWPEVLCWWSGSPATRRALFSMDHTNNKILDSGDCVSDSLPTAQCQVHRTIENLINEHPLCTTCYAGLQVDTKMGQIQYTPLRAMKWKSCVVLQEGRPGFRMLNFYLSDSTHSWPQFFRTFWFKPNAMKSLEHKAVGEKSLKSYRKGKSFSRLPKLDSCYTQLPKLKPGSCPWPLPLTFKSKEISNSLSKFYL